MGKEKCVFLILSDIGRIEVPFEPLQIEVGKR